VVLCGRVWPGGDVSAYDEGVVVLDEHGRIATMGPLSAVDTPADLPLVGGPACWVGPGVIDAHVHLAFGAPAELVSKGVTAVRDLGAPMGLAAGWRTTAGTAFGAVRSPHVAIAGPIITAPNGYPSRGWGRDGFALFAADPAAARDVVRSLVSVVDVIKVAIEPAGGPVPSPATVQAAVAEAHGAGMAVTAHALTLDAVRTAVAAGVDELAHTPTEPLPDAIVRDIVEQDILVVSTIQTMVDGDRRAGKAARANAAALCAAGARICYGSDLGNAGTRPGVDPRELRQLAEAGLGDAGALRAATVVAATAHGVRGARGVLVIGEPADLVVLPGDPLREPELWRSPTAVFVGGHRVLG
jgi:imidazolonepropionase-like amidohydrolase